MKQTKQKILSMLLALVMVLSMLPISALAADGSAPDGDGAAEKIAEVYKNVGDSMLANAKKDAPGFGTGWGEWTILGLARADKLETTDGQAIIDAYAENLKKQVKFNSGDRIHQAKSTENSRLILAMTAVGLDVTDLVIEKDNGAGGVTEEHHNLLNGLTDKTYLPKQGINGPIWALLAFDSANYAIPENDPAEKQVTRAGMINEILAKKLDGGGWALSGAAADPDMTGMALQALAPYYDKTVDGVDSAALKAAVDEAVNVLSQIQKADGGYASWGTVNSESCAQVIVALTALGINPQTDSRFIKEGHSVVETMCGFAAEDPTHGWGFKHTADQGWNGMATDQAYYALCAYMRFVNGENSLYNMTDAGVIKMVKDKIEAIGEVTLQKEETIADARAAYDGLSANQKTLIANYAAALTEAEERLSDLKVQVLPHADIPAMTKKAGEKVATGVGAMAKDQEKPLGMGSEWMILALARDGKAVPDAYYTNLVAQLKERLADKEKPLLATDYARTILALTAVGKNVTDVAGTNLLEPLADLDFANKQGANGTIFTLLALDSGAYEIPTVTKGGKQTTRAALINAILAMQLPDGAWVWSPEYSTFDADMTGMAVQALAPYYGKTVAGVADSAVKTAVDKALTRLSAGQNADGNYVSWGSASPESAAQVIVALTALDIDPAKDDRFIKNGQTLLDALCTFAMQDGGFHAGFSPDYNAMSTEQAYYALVSYSRLGKKQTSLYDMSDASVAAVTKAINAIGAVAPEKADAIQYARSFYDALADSQKKLIKNYGVLTAAESVLAQVKDADAVVAVSIDKKVLDAVLTKEERAAVAGGAPVQIYLQRNDISHTVSAADKKLAEDAVAKELKNGKIGIYLDIDLIKQVGDAAAAKAHDLSGKISVSIPIPAALLNTDKSVERVYSVIHIHDGKAEVLGGSFDAATGMFTFETDGFSTYALVYQDTAASDGATTPATGDSTPVTVCAVMMVVSCAAAAVWLVVNRKLKKK